MSDSSVDSNYINNLLSRISFAKQDVEDGVELQPLTDMQRNFVVSVLELLEYGLEAYEDSNYGCCQEVCEVKTEYDPPGGYSTEEELKKVAILTTLSNLGISKVPSNRSVKKWWKSVDNRMVRALSDEYPAKLVNWIFDFLGLQESDNPNFHELVYGVTSFLIYVVFGDPVLHLNSSSFSSDKSSVDGILDVIVKDVLGSDASSWRVYLEDINEEMTSHFMTPQAKELARDEVVISEESVYSFFDWLVSTLLPAINQIEENEDSALSFGEKMPNYPSGLWIIVNVVLAMSFSFLIGGARAKWGYEEEPESSTDNQKIKWVPPIGFAEQASLLEEYYAEDPVLREKFFNTYRSPFRSFSVHKAHITQDNNVRVEFTQPLSSEASVLTATEYLIEPNTPVAVYVGADNRSVILDFQNSVVWSEDLRLRVLGSGAIYNRSEEDYAPGCVIPIYASAEAARGRSFPEVVRWSARGMEIDSSGAPVAGNEYAKTAFAYFKDWHKRNLGPELMEAFTVLQSIGWMNLKGSNFAGFLHPDSACGPVVEELFCDYYNSIEPECIKVELEGSCGIFDCEMPSEEAVRQDISDAEEQILLSENTINTSAQKLDDLDDARVTAEQNKQTIEDELVDLEEQRTQVLSGGNPAELKENLEKLKDEEKDLLAIAQDPTRPISERKEYYGRVEDKRGEILAADQAYTSATQELDRLSSREGELKAGLSDVNEKIRQIAEAEKAQEELIAAETERLREATERLNTLNELLNQILYGSWSDVCDETEEQTIVTRYDGDGDFPAGTNDPEEAGILFARRIEETLSETQIRARLRAAQDAAERAEELVESKQRQMDDKRSDWLVERQRVLETISAINTAIKNHEDRGGFA